VAEHSTWTYSKAGVDLSKHKLMHSYALEGIVKLSQELGVRLENIGSYAPLIEIGGRGVTVHVDGVGTKTLVLAELNRFEVIGWDCVAMNVNDVACEGFRPIALVDYIAMPRPDIELFKRVFNGIVEAAKVSRVAVLGGETAILPDLVNGIDAVCTVIGVKIGGFVNAAREGDEIVGVSSWGLHANGFSLVRRIVESTVGGYKAAVSGVDLGEELSKPTAIYSNLILDAISRGLIHAAAHITGGAFRKVKRILGAELDAYMKMPEPPKVFRVIMELGKVPVSEMYSVFNMGVGLVFTAPKEKVGDLVELVNRYGFAAHRLGTVVKGSGTVYLDTPFGERVEL